MLFRSWDQQIARLFNVGLRVVVVDQRGVLAKVATAIAGAGCNIANVSIDNNESRYATNSFTLQVTDRQHLARVMRALRRIPEVVRITRSKD